MSARSTWWRVMLALGAVLALRVAAGSIRAEFQNDAAPTARYQGATDITITVQDDPDKDPNANFASNKYLAADGFSARQSSLIRFAVDGGQLPAAATVTGAQLMLYATNETYTGFSIYELLRDWNEGEATYLRPMSGQSWGAAGAAGAGVDRSDTPFATFGHFDAGTYVALAVTDAGVDLIRRWQSGATPNYGVVMEDFDSWDKLAVDSSEGTNPPYLQVFYGTTSATIPVTEDTMLAYQPLSYEGWGLGFSGRAGGSTASLVRWDVRAIPPGVQVTNARIDFTVSRIAASASAVPFDVYPASVPWTEQADWRTYDGTHPWGLDGAQGVTDHGTKVGSLPFCGTPQSVCAVTFPDLPVVVQAWVNGQLPNNGFLIQNYFNVDDLQLIDSEGPVVGRRPKLVVDFTWDAGRPPGLYPAYAEVYPGERVQMVAVGGAGPYQYSVSGGSSATIDQSGLYMAGPLLGQDQVSVVDQTGDAGFATIVVLGTAISLDGGSSPISIAFTSAPAPVHPLDNFAVAAAVTNRATFPVSGFTLALSGQAVTVDAPSLDGGRLPGSPDAGFALPVLDPGASVQFLVTGVMRGLPSDSPSVTADVKSGPATVASATTPVPLDSPAAISTGCGCGAEAGGLSLAVVALALAGILQSAAARRASRPAQGSCPGENSQQ